MKNLYVKENLKDHESQRVVTALTRQEVDFLDKFGKDAQFSCGRKLSRSKIIRFLVSFIMELGMSGNFVSSPEDFKVRVMDFIKETLWRRQSLKKPEEKQEGMSTRKMISKCAPQAQKQEL